MDGCPQEDVLQAALDGRLAHTSPEAEHIAACHTCRAVLALAQTASIRESSASHTAAPRSWRERDQRDHHDQRGPFEPGSTLGRYRILGRIGEGAMGVVYAAHDAELDRRIAIKVLHPVDDTAPAPGELRSHRLSEAQAMARLTHPNVIRVYDVGEHDGSLFIAMELVEGLDLAAWLRERPRPWRELLPLFIAAGRGLAAAHDAGLVHCDFKPANVLVRRDGHVFVTDFGLAHAPPRAMAPIPSVAPALACRDQSDEGPSALPHAIVGTPAYMAPEVILGEGATPSSDLFSFGVSLYEALFGRLPFLDGSLSELRAELLLRTFPAPSASGRPQVPRWLRAELARMLDPDPGGRHASVRALVEALEDRSLSRWFRPGALLLAAATAIALFTLALTRPLAPTPSPHPHAEPRRAPPSIAVLPFTALGESPEPHLAIGVTEDMTAMLARAPDLAVTAPASALGHPSELGPREVGAKLGVDYVLVGSVRREHDKLRITARMVDSRSGLDVWAERFDESGPDPWTLQDRVTGRIVAALTGELGELKRAEYRATFGADTTTLAEYDYYLRGHERYMRLTPADNEAAARIWSEGLTHHPDSALLLAKLGFYHFMRPYLFLSGDPATDYRRAGELARRALAQPRVAPLPRRLAHWLLAYVLAAEGDHERALAEVELTTRLAPFDAFQLGDLASIQILANRPADALTRLDEAEARDPANAPFYRQLRGWALVVAGDPLAALAALETSIELPTVPLLQAIALTRLGRTDEARAKVAAARARYPHVTLGSWRAANFYRDPDTLTGQLTDLRAAGLPDSAPER